MSAPVDEIAEFLRAKFGRPSPDVERVIEAFAALAGGMASAAPAAATVPDDVAKRLDAIEARLAKLEAAAASDQPDVLGRLDTIDRALVLVQGAVSKLEAAPHLAAPARAVAPARAAAPAAKPAA